MQLSSVVSVCPFHDFTSSWRDGNLLSVWIYKKPLLHKPSTAYPCIDSTMLPSWMRLQNKYKAGMPLSQRANGTVLGPGNPAPNLPEWLQKAKTWRGDETQRTFHKGPRQSNQTKGMEIGQRFSGIFSNHKVVYYQNYMQEARKAKDLLVSGFTRSPGAYSQGWNRVVTPEIIAGEEALLLTDMVRDIDRRPRDKASRVGRFSGRKKLVLLGPVAMLVQSGDIIKTERVFLLGRIHRDQQGLHLVDGAGLILKDAYTKMTRTVRVQDGSQRRVRSFAWEDKANRSGSIPRPDLRRNSVLCNSGSAFDATNMCVCKVQISEFKL